LFAFLIEKDVAMDEQEIKRTIQNILEILEFRRKRARWIYFSGLFAILGIAFLLNLLNLFDSLDLTIFAFVVFFGGSAISAMVINAFSMWPAVKSYNKAFSPDSTERGEADHLLSRSVVPPMAVEVLCAGLGILRGEKGRLAEIEKAKAESFRILKQHTRDTYTLTDTCQCGSCGATVTWSSGARYCVCSTCKTTLMIPFDMACPHCGGSDIRLLSKPRKSMLYSTAGFAVGRLVGLWVGSWIDNAVANFDINPPEQIIEPVFYCDSCEKNWGIKFPVATRESERMLPSGDGNGDFVVDLEKLSQLKNQGVLTEEEFIAAKQKLTG
jgi:hypothetical protein